MSFIRYRNKNTERKERKFEVRMERQKENFGVIGQNYEFTVRNAKIRRAAAFWRRSVKYDLNQLYESRGVYGKPLSLHLQQ